MQRNRIHIFATALAVCTFFLLIAGALVTSTGSGLAVPDWPLSFGQFFPKMEGGVFFEHGHRMVAGTIGVLTLLFAAALLRSEPRRWVRWTGAFALGAVGVQAVLGGLTVLFGLPPQVSIAHAVLAQTFFCLITILAIATSPRWSSPAGAGVPPAGGASEFRIRVLQRLSAVATGLVFLQLFLGAGLRHGGGLLFLKLHMAGAVVASTAVLILGRLFLRWMGAEKIFALLGAGLSAGILVQVFLGVLAVSPVFGFSIYISGWVRTALVTAHVALGALILAGCLAGALWTRRLARPIYKEALG